MKAGVASVLGGTHNASTSTSAQLQQMQNAWSRHASALLLQMVRRAPEYHNDKNKLFEHPLSDCTFNSVNVDSSWHGGSGFGSGGGGPVGSQPLTPLFVNSSLFASQSQMQATGPAGLSSMSSQLGTQAFMFGASISSAVMDEASQIGVGMVRATQAGDALKFSATQFGGTAAGGHGGATAAAGGNMGTQADMMLQGRTAQAHAAAVRKRRESKRRFGLPRAPRTQTPVWAGGTQMLFHLPQPGRGPLKNNNNNDAFRLTSDMNPIDARSGDGSGGGASRRDSPRKRNAVAGIAGDATMQMTQTMQTQPMPSTLGGSTQGTGATAGARARRGRRSKVEGKRYGK
jgi:hypothetical protein